MNKAIGIGVTLAFAAAVGWLLYQNVEQRRQQERVLAEVREQADAQRAQLEQIVSQQQTIAQQQDKIRATVDETQDVVSAGNDRASLLIRDDVTAVSSLRVAVAEYYATTGGKMPATQADMGLPPPEHYRGQSMKSATLLPDGRIELVFDAQSGVDGGRILFVPDLTHALAMGIQWRCETPDYPRIKRALAACDYQPAK
jgi:hypothetical protein